MVRLIKTLKDLEEGKYMYKGLVQIRHVREEAIKWIKFNEEAKEKNMKLPDRMGEHYSSLNEGAIIFIKHFFNITSEDLK